MDWTLLHAINSTVASHDWAEDPTTAIAGLFVPAYALATLGLWFLARPGRDERPKLACANALAAAAVAMATNQLISHLWVRPRPYASHHDGLHLLSAPSADPSFPSDHAAAAFAIAFAVFLVWRRVGIGFLVAATLIAVSRLALGMHYPSDVVAGMLVGWSSAALVVRLAGRPVEWVVELVSRVTDPLVTRVVVRRRTTSA